MIHVYARKLEDYHLEVTPNVATTPKCSSKCLNLSAYEAASAGNR